MSKKLFTPKLLVAILASLSASAYQHDAFAQVAEQHTENAEDEQELAPVEVTASQLSTDEKGKEEVFRKNVSNLYLGKKELERYRIDSAGDILKGLNGVYNMNSRTAGGAITPNIRGVTGKGRIPVTIDGTEQTVDVWLNNYGVGDRNYVDPALFRSIAVEKSPAMTRGMKSGVGGSIAIRTIEPDDIIPEGQSWGLQFKAEGSNNSVQPQGDLSNYLGKDYRQVGGTADGAGGGTDWATGQMSPFSVILDDIPQPRQKTGANNFKLGGDKSLMLAGAFKTDYTDGLIAYSHRKKGNYFSGKNGAEGYLNNPVYKQDECGIDCLQPEAFIPNMARMFKPGQEVLNSNTETKTLLLKNNWHLPDNQKIGLQFMQNDIRFGEINPFQMTWVLGMAEYNPHSNFTPQQVQNIDSHIKSNTYKLSYEWKPENNSWIDLEANLWRTQTRSDRHQSGGMSLAVAQPDPVYDAWHYCNVRHQLPPSATWASDCNAVGAVWGFTKDTTKEQLLANHWVKNEDGKQNIISGALQHTKVTRDGLDISNRFKLSDTLNLTLGADIQRETLKEKNMIINGADMFNILGMTTQLASLAGPRGGKRQEWGINMGLNWQATDRLNIQAGVRYHNFKAEDTAMAEQRANRNPAYGFGAGAESYTAGITLPYFEIIPDSEKELIAALTELKTTGANAFRDPNFDWLAYRELRKEVEKRFNIDLAFRDPVVSAYQHGHGKDTDPSTGKNYIKHPEKLVHYRLAKQNYIPFKNGKLDASANSIYADMFDEKISNPQGKEGEYYKYIMHPIDTFYPSYEEEKNSPYDSIPSRSITDLDNAGSEPKSLVKKITNEERWAEPEKMRGHAWAPMIAMTYRLGDNHQIFARYAQMTRFPSIYEATSSAVGGLISQPTTPGLDLKPERSLSWEVGYGFNFAPYIEGLKMGDVRLTYFNNTIKNVLDTTADRRITQYDKKLTRGLELQTRVDTGKYFASLGATYRLKQETCDADTAMMHDMYRRRIPDCIEGGFGATRFYQALQPKYSINAELGARLLDQKLELGVRGIYHSGVNTKQYQTLVAQGLDGVFITTGKPYHWRPQLIVDLYGRYQVNKTLAINVGVTNLTNRYFLDPMSNVPTPGPGRTVTLGMQAQF